MIENPLYIPIIMDVSPAVDCLRDQRVLTNCKFDISLLIDEVLSYLFYNHQSTYRDLVGAESLMALVGYKLDNEVDRHEFNLMINQMTNVLIRIISDVCPEFIPNKDKAIYNYSGGRDLMIYVNYDAQKYPNISTKILVPESAIANIDKRFQK